jgi:hypothetical protein
MCCLRYSLPLIILQAFCLSTHCAEIQEEIPKGMKAFVVALFARFFNSGGGSGTNVKNSVDNHFAFRNEITLVMLILISCDVKHNMKAI